MAHRHFHHGLFEDPWEGMSHPYHMFCQQHFGFTPIDDVFRQQPARHCPRCILCHNREHPGLPYQMQIDTDDQSGVSKVENTDTEFRISLDLQYFKPQEINVKTRGNRLIVHAQHGEQPDQHGYIKREFTRQYVLPRDVDPSTVTSSLSREGRLTLRAPKRALQAPREHVVSIT